MDEIRELRPLHVPGRAGGNVENTHVAFDGAGGMHMLFDHQIRVYYTRSTDGANWSQPVCLIPKPRDKAVRRGQLILHDGRACLIYEHSDGAFLRRVTMGEGLIMGPDVRITNGLAPLNGMRLCRTKDGEAVLLAGAETAWALRAKLKELLVGGAGE